MTTNDTINVNAEVMDEVTNGGIDVALRTFVNSKNLNVVEDLLDRGANPNIRDRRGYTALDDAIKLTNNDIIRSLVRHGAVLDTSRVDYYLGNSPYLHDFRRILVNITDNAGNTVLDVAIKDDDMETVYKLMDQGATLDTSRATNYLLAAARTGNDEMVRFLMQIGGDPYATDKDGNTVLMIAARGGHKNIVNRFLRYYTIDAYTINNDNLTALMWATKLENVSTLHTGTGTAVLILKNYAEIIRTLYAHPSRLFRLSTPTLIQELELAKHHEFSNREVRDAVNKIKQTLRTMANINPSATVFTDVYAHAFNVNCNDALRRIDDWTSSTLYWERISTQVQNVLDKRQRLFQSFGERMRVGFKRLNNGKVIREGELMPLGPYSVMTDFLDGNDAARIAMTSSTRPLQHLPTPPPSPAPPPHVNVPSLTDAAADSLVPPPRVNVPSPAPPPRVNMPSLTDAAADSLVPGEWITKKRKHT